MFCSETHEALILVISCGNPLRRDDGLGGEVLARLARRINPRVVRLRDTHQLTPELAEEMSHARLVVFVDAAQDLEPGEVRVACVRPFPGSASSMTHQLSPEGLLAACTEWYTARPDVFVCSMGGAQWGAGQSLSMSAQQAVPELLRRIEQVICNWLARKLINAEPWQREPSYA